MKTGHCPWLKPGEQKQPLKPIEVKTTELVAKTNIPEICPHSGGLCGCGGHCGQYYNTKQKKEVIDGK